MTEIEEVVSKVRTLDERLIQMDKETAVNNALYQMIVENQQKMADAFEKVAGAVSSVEKSIVAMQAEIKQGSERTIALTRSVDEIAKNALEMESLRNKVNQIDSSAKDGIKRMNDRIDGMKQEYDTKFLENNKKMDEHLQEFKKHEGNQTIDIVALGKSSLVNIIILISGSIIVSLIVQYLSKPTP